MSTLAELYEELQEVKSVVDHGEAVYNPQALKAVRIAEALRADLESALRKIDASESWRDLAVALIAADPGDGQESDEFEQAWLNMRDAVLNWQEMQQRRAVAAQVPAEETVEAGRA